MLLLSILIRGSEGGGVPQEIYNKPLSITYYALDSLPTST